MSYGRARARVDGCQLTSYGRAIARADGCQLTSYGRARARADGRVMAGLELELMVAN